MKKNIIITMIALVFVALSIIIFGCKSEGGISTLKKDQLKLLQTVSPEFIRFAVDSEESFFAELDSSRKIKIHREMAKPIVHEKSMGTTRIWIEKDKDILYTTEIPGQYHLAGYYSNNFELLVYQLFPDGGFIRASGLAMINLKTGKRRKIGPEGSFQYASLAPDGKHALLVSDDEIVVVQLPDGRSYQIPVEGIAHAADPWINDVAGGSVNLSGEYMDFEWSKALQGRLLVRDEKRKTTQSIPIKIDREKIMENKISRRKRMISTAVEKMKMRGFADFDASLFPIIKVRESEDDLYVSFDRPIYFYPLNSVYLYAATVRINTVDESYKIQENPPDMEYDIEKVKCFVMTKELKKKFDFVIGAINASNQAGKIDPEDLPTDFEMEIWERKDHYEIGIEHQYYSFYKIKKETGQIYDAGHKHYAPEPFDEKKVYWEVVDFELFNKNVRSVTEGMEKAQVLELIGKPTEEKGNVWLFKDLEGLRMPEPGEQVVAGASITFRGEVVNKIGLSWRDATGAGTGKD
jgi:hypothetical protein